MRTPVWAVPILMVPACSAGYAARPAALSPTPAARLAQPPGVTAIWRVVRAEPASRDVALSFFAAACSAVKRIVVAESAVRVVVTLDMAGREGKDCTEPFVRHRLVHLAAPLGDRALYDGGVAPPARVRAGG